MFSDKLGKVIDRGNVYRNLSIILIFISVLAFSSSSHADDLSQPSVDSTAVVTLDSGDISAETDVVGSPSFTTSAKNRGLHKDTDRQSVPNKKWTEFQGGGFTLNGDRALFFAQLHLTCTKKPKYVKIRLARHIGNGKLDTTGTNTWVLGKDAPLKWQGSLWWESRTKHPISAQFKVVGGKCYSPQRQFKFWQP